MISAWVANIAFWLVVIVYFICLDTLAPVLIRKGYFYLWWVCLLALLWLAYKTGWLSAALLPSLNQQAERRFREHRGHYIIAIFLLGVTLFLYDPTFQPTLAGVGLSWLWIVPLIALFSWLFFSYWKLRKLLKQQKVGKRTN